MNAQGAAIMMIIANGLKLTRSSCAIESATGNMKAAAIAASKPSVAPSTATVFHCTLHHASSARRGDRADRASDAQAKRQAGSGSPRRDHGASPANPMKKYRARSSFRRSPVQTTSGIRAEPQLAPAGPRLQSPAQAGGTGRAG